MTGAFVAAGVGLVAGALSGAFGVGGGVVTTPAIRLLLGYPELIAVGTPLPVILPTALAGALTHLRKGSADLRLGLVLGLWGMPASVVGALMSRVLGGTVVLLLTAVVVVVAAVDMLRPAPAPAPAPRRPASPGHAAHAPAPAPLPRVAAIGATTGVYSGLLGLGGGFVLVPMLRRFAGQSVKAAIGTSLVAVAMFAIPGSITHWAIGNVDVSLALALCVGVIPGAVLGARLTVAASETHVRTAFALFLGAVGVVLGVNELGLL